MHKTAFSWLVPKMPTAFLHPVVRMYTACFRRVALAALVFTSSHLFCQELPVKRLTSREGLSMDYITTLHQDRRGFIWMGTFFGLNRYDGDGVRVFRPNHLDPWSLHANKINDILEDAHGLLWLSTDNGLAILDPWSERIVHLDKLNGQFSILNIRKALLDKNGRVWIYHELQGAKRLLGIQTNAEVRTQIRAGKPLKNFDLTIIALPQSFANGLNAFLQTSDSTAVAIDSKGNCAAIHLLHKTAVKKRMEEVSVSLSPFVQYIPDPIRKGGTLFFPNHDFANGFQADQMHEYLQLPDGRVLVSRFFDTKIYVLQNLQELRNFTPADLQEKIPVFCELGFPTTFSRLIDRNGDLWIGTTGSGIYKVSTNTNGYTQIARQLSIYNFTVLPDQTLWAGAFAQSSIINLSDAAVREAPWQAFFKPEEAVKAVLSSKDKRSIYLIVDVKEENSLIGYQYQVASREIRQLPVRLLPLQTPPQLLEDRAGNIWICGNAGEIIRYHPKENQSAVWDIGRSFPKEIASQITIQHLIEAKNGTIWIASNFGLTKIEQPEAARPVFKAYHNYGGKTKIFANNGIFALCQDQNDPDILWLGTLGNGLAKFHIPTEKVSYFSQEDLSNRQIVLGIVPDNANRLWLSTDQGITCFDPVHNQFISYDLQETLQAPQFNATGFGKLQDGSILFGSTQGLFVLYPNKLLNAPLGALSRKIEISKIQVNNTSVDELFRFGNATFSPDGHLRITLKHNENNINIQFAAPFASNPQSLYYRYKVSGLSGEWVNLGKQRTISLPGLAPGKYQVHIQVANPEDTDLQTPPASIVIRIRPPWYLSNFANVFYALLATCLIILGLRLNKKRLAEQFAAEISQQEMKRLQSLDMFKNKFFAYIAHEIKTPLSIILGIGEKLQQEGTNPVQNKYLDTIQYEGNNMQSLIDEIIDITRIQDGSIQLNYRHGDVVAFLKNALASYQPLANFREVQLQFHSDTQTLFADFDDQRVRHIVNNLINNALRHTPQNGIVTLSVQNPSPRNLRISVADTGQGIAASDLPFIFEKYYQGASATKTEHNFGLGLSYVKDLADLMQGQVFAESTLQKGSKFTVELPLKITTSEMLPALEAPDTSPNSLEEIESTLSALGNQNLPLLLIVEDNPMIVSVLKLSLAPYFRLITARDGQEGLATAIAEIPDLLLTDIVMPVMDGLEMTKILKANPLTAHIPVVVLSAKNDIADRLEGQECGAEAYIGKPYHSRELLLTLRNLQNLQQQWKLRYANFSSDQQGSTKDSLPAESIVQGTISANDKFMQSRYDAFKNHYTSETFDIPQLCKMLHISKAQLYRKLSAISDQGPMELLKDFRLEKALELLQNNPDLSTSEVAFQVGFRERTYFSTQFKKKFGVAPSMVRART